MTFFGSPEGFFRSDPEPFSNDAATLHGGSVVHGVSTHGIGIENRRCHRSVCPTEAAVSRVMDISP